MTEYRSVLERAGSNAPRPDLQVERVLRRRDRKRRNQRVRAGVLGLAIAIGVGWLGVNAIRSTPPVPADDRSEELGIFAPVAGRIVYVNGTDYGYDDLGYGAGLWAVDPSGPSDPTEGLRVADDVASRLVQLPQEPLPPDWSTEPLGWSSDGTELLLVRSDGGLFPDNHLYILHADGSETRLNVDQPSDLAGATIAPDGSRVVFAGQGDLVGLFVVDKEGGRPVPLPIPQAEEGASAPTFSPDGTQIAYLAGNRTTEVWVADADGSNAHEILANLKTLAGGGGEGLQWSPAGDRIAIQAGDAIYTFALDGSDFTQVVTGAVSPYWSPDGSQIAYNIICHEQPDGCGSGSYLYTGGLAIADADGSNVREFGFAASGPWHPGAGGGESEDVLDPTPTRFVGQWASTDYSDGVYGDASHQTMTIRAGENDVLHITVHKDVSDECGEKRPGRDAQYHGTTMTGSGRLEGLTTLVVPYPVLACDDGPKLSAIQEEGLSNYTLVLDIATSRLYDTLGGVWNRGAPAESRTRAPTERGVDGPGTFSMLHGEVTFRAAEPWNDHVEAYIDPRLFFLIGPGDEFAEAEMTILVNPLPPEAPCGRRVPPSAGELVQAIRSNPDLEATGPVIERVGGIDALRMDVVAVPGASDGPCTAAHEIDVVSVPGRPWASVGPGDLGRLYVLDLPGGSARTMAIWITAPLAATAPFAAVFEQAVETAAPILDSFEFHAP